ncbi:hypothetical protein SAMN04488057_11246 [Cyclobacterium lianum]|uniref:Uncharacterized protein n=1 Tax=Cyclobacterium lianum TaxID=388280 RepID=A0A1M7PZ48_9BACT|nr:hypothetical protein [Cyclobacterium lianum]SHN23002.1 hypothetical protein SAMN04488057_11246 [Cyclobacterium lianum]
MKLYPYVMLTCLAFILHLPRNYCFDQGSINLVLDSIEVVLFGEVIDVSELNIENRYKIVTVVDGDDPNFMAQLKEIGKAIDKIGSHSPYTFMIYVRGDNIDPASYGIGDKGLFFKYPLLYDSQDAFRKANPTVSKLDGYSVFLLDSDSEILLKNYSFSDEFVSTVIEHSQNHPKFIDSPLPRPKPL